MIVYTYNQIIIMSSIPSSPKNTIVLAGVCPPANKKTAAAVTGLAQQYQKKTDREHILDNPDTYIGSVENVDANMWVFDETQQKIILKQIEYLSLIHI